MIRILADIGFYFFGKQRGRLQNVCLKIAGLDRFQRLFDDQLVPTFLPNDKGREDRCPRSKRDHGEAFVGCGRHSEIVDEHGFASRRILIEQESDGGPFPEKVNDFSRRRLFI